MQRAVLIALACFVACRAPAPAPVELRYASEDPALPRELLESQARAVASFFDSPFLRPFAVEVLPSRAAFDASLPAEWQMTPTQCWMVACGVADRLRVLSPSVWRTEACEHDPSDAEHVRGIVAHELVHVFHGQHNRSGDFSACDGIDWFVEGLATYASGQLAQSHSLDAHDALANGVAPTKLADAWKGRYRYGVSASLVQFLDHRLGRDALVRMLAATNASELLALAGMTEDELLLAWRASVEAQTR
jgi:hypothetical protein